MSNSIWHKRDETPKDFCEVDASNGWLAANAKKALETIGKHKE